MHNFTTSAHKSSHAGHTSAIRSLLGRIQLARRECTWPQHISTTHAACASSDLHLQCTTGLQHYAKSRILYQASHTHTQPLFRAHTPRIQNSTKFPPHLMCAKTERQCEQTVSTQTGANKKEQTRMHAQAAIFPPHFEVLSATIMLAPRSPKYSTSSKRKTSC